MEMGEERKNNRYLPSVWRGLINTLWYWSKPSWAFHLGGNFGNGSVLKINLFFYKLVVEEWRRMGGWMEEPMPAAMWYICPLGVWAWSVAAIQRHRIGESVDSHRGEENFESPQDFFSAPRCGSSLNPDLNNCQTLFLFLSYGRD